MDVWLKNQIKVGVKKIVSCDNPGKTSKKIFKQYRELQDSGEYVFTQKKFSSHGYEYYVRRSN